MGKRKHSRPNKVQRDTAERVVGLWYVGQCEERNERFRSVNTVPVAPSGSVSQISDRWKAWTTAYNDKYDNLSANGKEKHVPDTDAPALTQPMDLDSKGGYHPNRNLMFAQKIMRHVMAVDPVAYDTLEMNSAGYDRKGIARELQCSESMADSYKSSGLSIVMSCILLKHELGWHTNDGKAPNPYAYA